MTAFTPRTRFSTEQLLFSFEADEEEGEHADHGEAYPPDFRFQHAHITSALSVVDGIVMVYEWGIQVWAGMFVA